MAPAKKAAAKKATPKKAPAKKTAVKKAAPAKKAAVKKATPKKAPAKKTAVKKAAEERKPHGEVTVVRKGASTAIKKAVSPTTGAMLDVLCDSHWHDKSEVLAAGVQACKEFEADKALHKGKAVRKAGSTKDELLESGAAAIARNNLMIAERSRRIQFDKNKERVRMNAATAREWRRTRSQQAKEDGTREAAISKPRQFFGEEQEFGGWMEFDAWALAPLEERDVAYVRPNVDFDIQTMRTDFPDWNIAAAPDGLLTIAAPAGTAVKEIVTQWMADHEIYHEGVRDARGVKRRNISDLPPEFLEALVRKYTPYAMRRIRDRHYMAMQRLTDDHDDIEGEVALWVIEAIADFNPDHGSPFGAWLTNSIPNRVGDLSRAAHGRTAADAEMRRARAQERFEAEHGRPPTWEELRQALGLTREEMHRKERDLAQLRGLRSVGALEMGPEEQEVPVVDLSADPEGEAMHLETMQRVSRALLAASGEWDPDNGRPLRLRHVGFLITYLTHWGEWTKGDLTHLASKTARAVSDEVRAVQLEMANQLNDLKVGRTGRPMPTGDVAIS